MRSIAVVADVQCLCLAVRMRVCVCLRVCMHSHVRAGVVAFVVVVLNLPCSLLPAMVPCQGSRLVSVGHGFGLYPVTFTHAEATQNCRAAHAELLPYSLIDCAEYALRILDDELHIVSQIVLTGKAIWLKETKVEAESGTTLGRTATGFVNANSRLSVYLCVQYSKHPHSYTRLLVSGPRSYGQFRLPSTLWASSSGNITIGRLLSGHLGTRHCPYQDNSFTMYHNHFLRKFIWKVLHMFKIQKGTH